MVGGGDAVEIAELSTLPALVADPEVKIESLFRDPAMLVVDKPAPMACHPLRPGERGTLMNGVVAAFPEAAAAGDNPREGRPGPSARQRNLGGAARGANAGGLHHPSRGDSRRAESVGCRALVAGNLKQSLEIDKPLTHDPRNARRMTVAVNVPGSRTARTSLTIHVWTRQKKPLLGYVSAFS